MSATTGIRAVELTRLERPQHVDAVGVREPQVEQDHVRARVHGDRDGVGAARRLERPESVGAQDVPGQLQVRLVVVDDEDERLVRRRRSEPRVWS